MTGPEALRAAVIDWERRLLRACGGYTETYWMIWTGARDPGCRGGCFMRERPGYYVDLEIAGLERNLLRTVKLLADGDLAAPAAAFGNLAPWGDGTGNPYTLRGIPWREYREILVAKQARRRDRLVYLLRRTGRLPAQERRGQRWGRRDRPWSRP